MQSITLQTHIGLDGVLKLEVPVGVADIDLEVVVTLQTVEASINSEAGSEWPLGFFERTFGVLADEPLQHQNYL